MILCDIGNTFFHFYQSGKIWKEPVSGAIKTESTDEVFYISVNEKASRKLVAKFPSAIDIESIIKIDTAYRGLGVDRAAVCLAVSDGVIIDAGSAITVDVMQNGTHLGGYILPGFSAYEKCYSGISQKLDVDINMNVSIQSLPQNTVDAVSYAIIKSISLMLRDTVKTKPVFLLGGDGKYLSKYFENSIYDASLIFKGMMRAIEKYKG